MAMSDEEDYNVLKVIDANPEVSQRQLAKKLGVSLGKINYCIQSLIKNGVIESRNKNRRIVYVLTPKGYERKNVAAKISLKNKVEQYEVLSREIKLLMKEVSGADGE